MRKKILIMTSWSRAISRILVAMKVSIKTEGKNFRMIAENETGNRFQMDGSEEIGGENTGFRPMQLLLAAIGGCSTIDVRLILKKQKQDVELIEVEVEGQKIPVEQHSVFQTINLNFRVKGAVSREKVEKAIKLSLDKYCSVAKTLEPTAKISFELTMI